MPGTVWKQIPNLEQVFTVVLVPTLFTAIVLLLLIGSVWTNLISFKRHVRSLEGNIRVLAARLSAVALAGARE